MPLLKIVPLSDDSRALYEGHSTYHEGDSGLDLFVATDITIGPGETKLIPLGFSGALYNNEGQNVSWLLMPRSSIYKTPIRLANSIGLIDAGYRGEVKAAVDNIKQETFVIKKGDRFFQAVSFTGEPLTLQVVDRLDSTSRGTNGHGSTGLSANA